MATMTIGSSIDDIRKLQLKREKLAVQAEAIGKQIKEKEDRLLLRFKKSDLKGAVGKLGRCEIVEKDVPSIDDMDKVIAFASANDASDIVQKRVNVAAVQARWERGEQIPGVGKFHLVQLKVKALKAKRK